MAQRIFIKVVGFSDEERHALNTIFHLSERCRTMYQLWTAQAPEPPRIALLDGQSWEARVEAESPSSRDLHLLWVGPYPPSGIWRSFERPLVWPLIVGSLDSLFVPVAVPDIGAASAEDSVLSRKQALIVSADRERRLYLRARLALARLPLADEADSGARALELARDRQYDLALVDSTLGEMDAWTLLRRLREGPRPIAHVALTHAQRSLPQRLRAWLRGVDALLENPPHHGRLKGWLSRV